MDKDMLTKQESRFKKNLPVIYNFLKKFNHPDVYRIIFKDDESFSIVFNRDIYIEDLIDIKNKIQKVFEDSHAIVDSYKEKVSLNFERIRQIPF